jgi:hypothetical protein
MQEPEKERRQKTPADVALVFRGLSAQKPNRLHRGAKQYPAGWKELRRGLWTEGNEPYADLRLSPRACLTWQAGFTAARPAANSIRSSVAERSCAAVHSLEASARLCLARRVGAELRRDADCAPEDGSGDFPRCTVRKIGFISKRTLVKPKLCADLGVRLKV